MVIVLRSRRSSATPPHRSPSRSNGRTAFIAWTASARGNAPSRDHRRRAQGRRPGAPAHPRPLRRAAREPAAQPGALRQRLRGRPGRRRPDVRVPGPRAGRRHDRQDDHDRHPPRQLERAERAARPAEHRDVPLRRRHAVPLLEPPRAAHLRPGRDQGGRSDHAAHPRDVEHPARDPARARRSGRSTTTSRSPRSTPTAGTCRSTARPCSPFLSLLDPAASCGRVSFQPTPLLRSTRVPAGPDRAPALPRGHRDRLWLRVEHLSHAGRQGAEALPAEAEAAREPARHRHRRPAHGRCRRPRGPDGERARRAARAP